MDVYVNRQGKIDVGIVFQRGLMQFWVPSTMQPHLPYNPNHVPAQRIPDPLWYWMWFECLRVANVRQDMELADKLLVEVLRR